MNAGRERSGIEISGWRLRMIITDSSGTAHGTNRSFDSLGRPAAPRIRNMADFPPLALLRTLRSPFRRFHHPPRIAWCLVLAARRSDKALGNGEGCGRGPAAGIELGHDVLDVRLRGAW